MNKLLKIEVAVLLILVVATVFVRMGITDSQADTPPEHHLGSQPLHSESTEAEQNEPIPTETEPEIILTFSEDFFLESRDYFVYDCSQEKVLAISGSLEDKIYPASITKLFTAYVALQYLQPEQKITLGREVNLVAPDSSVANVKNGQVISVAELVEGMLLPSGNDAAYGLAAAAARAESGDPNMEPTDAVAYFVTLMNQTARELEFIGSQFTNPDGYHDPEHYTCSQDLMTIAKLALENECIRTCVAIYEDRVTFSNGDVANWHNTNALINPDSQYYSPDAVGLKTGHTSSAGFCLLSAFEVEGDYYVVGTFGCLRPEDRFIDALKLYDVLLSAIQG